MQRIGNHWYKALWKIVTNPTVEVLAAMVVVILATWVVVQSEVDQRQHPLLGSVVVGPR